MPIASVTRISMPANCFSQPNGVEVSSGVFTDSLAGVRLGVFRLVCIGGIPRLFIVLRGFRKPTLDFGECGIIGVDHVTGGLSTVEDAHLPVINAAHHILPLCGIPHQFIIASESAGFLVLHLHTELMSCLKDGFVIS